MSEPKVVLGGPPAFHLLVKPAGAACNSACRYCYFLSKEALYPGSSFRMNDRVLEAYLRQLLEASQAPETYVSWQGGEPTLMGLDFYRRAAEKVERYRRRGQQVRYTIQTNGTLLDDAWGAFLAEQNYLVGLSLDGPREMHDAYRVDKSGQGTFDRVMRGWEVLQRHGVDTNILCSLHAANADHPLDVYRFLRDQVGARYIQFIPIVERMTPETRRLASQGWGRSEGSVRPFYAQKGHMVSDRSVRPRQYGGFLTAVFDEWLRRDVGRVFVQHFDASLANWAGESPGVCVFSETCGLSLVVEHTGDLFACDHYVEPDYRLGNLLETPLVEMLTSPQQRSFGLAKRDTLPRACRLCEVRFACQGECPRNRFASTADGEPGLNYLCAGYKLFFGHIGPAMRPMVDGLRQGRAPANVMHLVGR